MAELYKSNKPIAIFKPLKTLTYDAQLNDGYVDACNAIPIKFRLCDIIKPNETVAINSNIISVKYNANGDRTEAYYMNIKYSDGASVIRCLNQPDGTIKLGRFDEWEATKIPSGKKLVEDYTSNLIYIRNDPGSNSSGGTNPIVDSETDAVWHPKICTGNWSGTWYGHTYGVSNITSTKPGIADAKLGIKMVVGGGNIATMVANDSFIAIGIKGLTSNSGGGTGAIGMYKLKTDLNAKEVTTGYYLLQLDDITLGRTNLFVGSRQIPNTDNNTSTVYFTHPVLFDVTEYYSTNGTAANETPTSFSLYSGSTDVPSTYITKAILTPKTITTGLTETSQSYSQTGTGKYSNASERGFCSLSGMESSVGITGKMIEGMHITAHIDIPARDTRFSATSVTLQFQVNSSKSDKEVFSIKIPYSKFDTETMTADIEQDIWFKDVCDISTITNPYLIVGTWVSYGSLSCTLNITKTYTK